MSPRSMHAGKLAMLGGLYFVQGLPYGLQDKLVPLLLISTGHSLTSVALTRLLLLPWLTKAAFAPFVDMTLTKRKWVQLSLVALVATTSWNVLYELPTTTSWNVLYELPATTTISWQLLVTLWCLNLFSALQDIAVDGIALAILTTESELASGNCSQIVGYKLGSFFGSACLFVFYSLIGWRGLFTSLCLVYLIVLITFSYCIPPSYCGTIVKQSANQLEWNADPSSSISMSGLLVYVALYKLGEVAASATFPVFLTWSGTATLGQLVFWNGTVGVLGSIFGSLSGTFFSLRHLRLLLAWRLLPLALQLAVIITFDNLSFVNGGWIYYVSIASMLLLQTLGGLITTLTFTLMMTTCQSIQRQQTSDSDFGTTRYSFVSSVEVFGKLLFSSLSGLVVETIGFAPAHAMFLSASALCLLTL